MKKLLSFVLAIAMIAGLLPATAIAAETITVNHVVGSTQINYGSHSTGNHMANGHRAYCLNPEASAPRTGSFVGRVLDKSIASELLLIKCMYYLFGGPGYDSIKGYLSSSGNFSLFRNPDALSCYGYSHAAASYAFSNNESQAFLGLNSSQRNQLKQLVNYINGLAIPPDNFRAFIYNEGRTTQPMMGWDYAPTGDLRITKTTTNNNGSVSGFRFSVTKQDGTLVGTYTSDSTGRINIPSLVAGSYRVEETNLSTDFVAPYPNPVSVEVRNGETAAVTFNNVKKMGIITVRKTNGNPDMGTYSLANAQFTVRNASGAVVDTIITGADGKGQSIQLPLGTYTVVESKAPYGFVVDNTVRTATISGSLGTAAIVYCPEIIVADNPQGGKVKITKFDAETKDAAQGDATLSGAVFDLYDSKGNLIEQLNCGNNTSITSKEIPLGDYIVKEVVPPRGYNLSDTEYPVSIEYAGQEVDVVSVSIDVLNDVIKGRISIDKRSADIPEDDLVSINLKKTIDGRPIADVDWDKIGINDPVSFLQEHLRFNVHKVTNGKIDYDNIASVGIIKALNGTILFDRDIEPGAYVIIEKLSSEAKKYFEDAELFPLHIYIPEEGAVNIEREFDYSALYTIVNGYGSYIRNLEYGVNNEKLNNNGDVFPIGVTNADTGIVYTSFCGNGGSEQFAGYLGCKGYMVSNQFDSLNNASASDFLTAFNYIEDTFGNVDVNRVITQTVIWALLGNIDVTSYEFENMNLDAEEKAAVLAVLAAVNDGYVAEGKIVNVVFMTCEEHGMTSYLYCQPQLIPVYANPERTVDNKLIGGNFDISPGNLSGTVGAENSASLNGTDDTISSASLNGTADAISSVSMGEMVDAALWDKMPILEGIEFEVYLKSAGSYNNARESERDYLITDMNGLAVTKDLPYGLYVVKEVKGADEHYIIDPFEVYISENDHTYHYDLVNIPYYGKVGVIKVDAETDRAIPQAGIGFRIKNTDTGKWIPGGFFTNPEGWVELSDPLHFGNYELYEINSPFGYVLEEESLPFIVTITNPQPVLELRMPNESVMGQVIIEKTGELLTDADEITLKEKVKGNETEFAFYEPKYEARYLPGAVFDIIARADIITPDGTLRVQAGTVVDTITTDTDGKAESKPLYLGDYYAIEREAPFGMVLDTSEYDFSLEYEDQLTPVVFTQVGVYDERQKVEVSFLKECAIPENANKNFNPYASIVFGLFAREDILADDGSVAIPKDGLLEYVRLDNNGSATIRTDLPFGGYYLVELQTAENYYLCDAEYDFVFEYAGQDVTMVEIAVNNGIAILNLPYDKIPSKEHVDKWWDDYGILAYGASSNTDKDTYGFAFSEDFWEIYDSVTIGFGVKDSWTHILTITRVWNDEEGCYELIGAEKNGATGFIFRDYNYAGTIVFDAHYGGRGKAHEFPISIGASLDNPYGAGAMQLWLLHLTLVNGSDDISSVLPVSLVFVGDESVDSIETDDTVLTETDETIFTEIDDLDYNEAEDLGFNEAEYPGSNETEGLDSNEIEDLDYIDTDGLDSAETDNIDFVEADEHAFVEEDYIEPDVGDQIDKEPEVVIVVSVTPSASVDKLSGNQNMLNIMVTEKMSNGTINTISEAFVISNNAAGTYNVGSYKVYVATSGGTKISDCRIV